MFQHAALQTGVQHAQQPRTLVRNPTRHSTTQACSAHAPNMICTYASMTNTTWMPSLPQRVFQDKKLNNIWV